MPEKSLISIAIFLSTLLSLILSPASLITTTPHSATRPQYCNPAVVSYLMRDEKGDLLSESDLKNMCEQLPKTIDNAHPGMSEVSFAEDGKTYYWPESTDWPKGKKVHGLHFVNSETCTLHLTEVTLTYHEKKMRLVFNIDIARTQSDRRPVIDSLPFQQGTFELDLSDWTHEENRMIPAERWKKIKNEA